MNTLMNICIDTFIYTYMYVCQKTLCSFIMLSACVLADAAAPSYLLPSLPAHGVQAPFTCLTPHLTQM